MDLLKGCKRCNNCPSISNLVYNGDPTKSSYSVVCCTVITSKTYYDVINKWNNFNIEAQNLYRLNRHTEKWELVSGG